MRRLVLLILAALCLGVWAAAFFLLRTQSAADDVPLPTRMVLPSLTPTEALPPTQTPASPPTASPTLPATEPPMPTLTPTLAARLLNIVAVMPGVYLPPSATPYPPDVTVIPAVPNPYEPLAEATWTAPPYYGWYSFESDHPLIEYATRWERRLHTLASRGQYHRTEDVYSSVSFAFEGEGLRIRYVAARNMGMFQVVVDGVVTDTVDAYASEIAFPGTRVYTLAPGQHTVVLRSAGTKHAQSEGYTIALDAIQVWRGDPHTRIVPPSTAPMLPTEEPRPVQVELVSAPPVQEPTPTPEPPRAIRASVLIAYDENGNRTVDPAEGVAEISVRVVETNTNRVIASLFTDARGYAAFEIVSDTPAQIVVPYFGEAWSLQRGESAHTLLLTPGNQPGLIP